MPSLSQHQSNDFTKLTIEDVVAYFNRPVTVNEHGCWIWLGATDKNGYGRFGRCLVYGIVWRMAGNDLPSNHVLRHKCPHKGCINPDHIHTGTYKENSQDAVALGRMGRPAKLSRLDIEIINSCLAEGVPNYKIAAIVGVSQQWMNKFLKGGFKYAKPERSSI